MSDQEILSMNHISKSFFGVYALTDVSFSVERGEILSLIGENGAGKSTMMNIIGGILQPDGGQMKLRGQVYEPKKPGDAKENGIAFIHQELNLFNNLSIVDNVYINSFIKIKGTPFIKKGAMKEKVKEILKSVDLDIPPETLVEKLSMGEKQLVEIAKALSGDPDIIIFDEPTTSLTARETEKLFAIIERLRAEGKSIIYISHILADVMRLSDRIAVLRDGTVTDTGEKKTFTIERMISSMVGRDIKQMYPDRVPKAGDRTLLCVEKLSQPGIVKNISLTVKEGEIIGLFGLMGSGRSELANIIFGLDEYVEGKITFKGEEFTSQNPIERINKGMAFVTENRREEGLLMDFSVYHNVSLTSLRKYKKSLNVIDRKRAKAHVQEAKSTLKIKCEDVTKHLTKGLSGGNQQKVVLAKWLMADPDLIIVDEPTRGIDVGAKAEIYTILNELVLKGAGILVVSSEMEELMGICNRIIVMSKGEISGSFEHDEFNQESVLGAAFRQKKTNAEIN